MISIRNGLATLSPPENLLKWTAALILLFLVLVSSQKVTLAQESGQVEALNGSIQPGEFFWYRLPDLNKEQTLTVHVQGTTGNLDPIMGLVDGDADTEALEEAYLAAIQQALVDGDDPVLAAYAAADELFLTWDDDSGEGLAAAFAYSVPADGDYQLIISNALTALGQATFGDYELLVGLDAPEVLSGEALPTGETIAVLDREASSPGAAVEEFKGAITAESPVQTLDLHELRPGDQLTVLVEATSGDLRPEVVLLNYADKPVRTANLGGQETAASLEYTLKDKGSGWAVRIAGCCDEEGSTGEYSLFVGVNAADLLSGQAISTNEAVIKEPIPVAIGLKIQQIVEVDEQNEFFKTVASLQMEWDDPALAFSPDSCDCTFKTYTEQNFDEFLTDTDGRWPDFTIFNQQGNRWTQNRVAVIAQDGHAIYFERFSTDMQVDFDFRKYPFDNEEFLVRIDSIFPERFYYFTDLEGYSEISAEHGEDEFIIGDFETTVTSEEASTRATTSRFSFTFGGPRHLNYYIIQVFIPIVLILGVLWVTFFLKDYGLRIEVASANLLVFIAFSFSLADNYPRLGYITFLDATMVVTFILSALVIIYNVGLRRLEMNGKGEQANSIDNVMDWAYPLSIVGGALVLYLIFF